MKNIALALAVGLGATATAQAAPSVGISIGIQQPGVYGRIDIGSYPEPALVYPEPVLIAPSRVAPYQRPIYLYVPVAAQRDWRHQCARYGACGQPVYFVQEQWVRDRYRQEHAAPRGNNGNHGHGGKGEKWPKGRGDQGRGEHGRGNGR